jgi:prepilin-type N-terminal cleavage/methylation domain-containing protein
LGRPGGANARSTDDHAGGFSLLEVLVAFVILALVATALFRLFGGALSNASGATATRCTGGAAEPRRRCQRKGAPRG